MRKALNILISIIFITVLAGCSSLKRGRSAELPAEPAAADYAAIISSVIDNNITQAGFEIRKGSIELNGTEIEGKFGLHARLNRKGDFYCSVRGPLGIELVRLLMVGNDIAAIDRINRVVYVGKKNEVLLRNGMPDDFMTIIFGDMPSENNEIFRSSDNNEIGFISGNEEFTREVSICTNELKICSQKIDALSSDHEIYLSFGNFVSNEGRKYASLITMDENKKMFHVKLSIDDLILGYDSDIEFNLPAYRRETL